MYKTLFREKKLIIKIVLIVVLALAIRLLLVIKGSVPIFADEAIYIRWSQVMRAEETLRFLPLSDGKQPLYMWMVIPFLKFISDPLLAGRIFSTLCGISTLIGISSVSHLFFRNRKITITSALIYAVSPFTVFFDSLALVDGLLSMFGIWTIFFAYLALKYHRFDCAMLAGFMLGGAFLTKSPALYFALLLPFMLVLIDYPQPVKKNITIIFKSLILLIPTYLIGLGFYNILRLGTNYHLLATRNMDYVYPISHLFENPFNPLLFHLSRTAEWIWLLGPSIIVVLLVLSFTLNTGKYFKFYLVLFIWTFVPLVVSAEFAKVFTARYILFSMPTFIILASSVFLSKQYPKVLSALTTLLILHAVVIDYLLIFDIQRAPLPADERSGYLEEWTSGYGIRAAKDYIIKYHQEYPDKKIIVGTEGYFGTLPDGIQIYLNKYPEITVIGVGLGLSEIPAPLTESRKAGNTTFLVINNSRLKVQPEKLNARLVAQYPKALRRSGTKNYNTLGPQEYLYLFEVTENFL